MILPKAKSLLFLIDMHMARALAAAQSITGSLTIGFHPGLANGPLNAGIAEFRETRPDVELRVVEASPTELHRQLNERVIDIMFAALIPDLGGGANIQERLWDENLFVALRDDHPLVSNESLRWSDISSLPIIMRAHQGDLSGYRTIAARMGDQPFECNLHDVSRVDLIEMVKLGLGATITYSSAVVPREGIASRLIIDENALASIDEFRIQRLGSGKAIGCLPRNL